MFSESIMVVDSKINLLKERIQKIQNLRRIERQRFTESQATFYNRQHHCQHKLNRSLIINRVANTIASAPCYQYAMKKVSSLSSYSPTYIITKQTKVCEALHQIEVQTNQLRVLAKYYDSIQQISQNFLSQEISKSEVTAEDLLQKINTISIEMASIVYKYEAILDLQQHELLSLKEKNSYAKNIKQEGNDKKIVPVTKDLSAFSVVSDFFRSNIAIRNNNGRFRNKNPIKTSQTKPRAKTAKAA